MKQWIKDNGGLLYLLLLFGSGVCAGCFLAATLLTGNWKASDDARFMLECVSDFQYTAETCRDVLDGGDPPQQPDAFGEPGC